MQKILLISIIVAVTAVSFASGARVTLSGVCAAFYFAQAKHNTTAAIAPFLPYTQIANDYDPDWSPDGERIVYASGWRNDFKIYWVSAKVGTPKPFFNDNHSYSSPAWSPDGQRIAFASNRSGTWQIWTMRADGADPAQLTNMSAGFNYRPRWSPDGKQLAFTSLPGPHIYLVSVTGGEPKLFADGRAAMWAPDGKRIAFTSPSETPLPSAILIKQIDEGATTRLNSTTVTDPPGGFSQWADWTPDGRRLVCNKFTNGTSHLAIINVAEDKVESTIEVNGSPVTPHWSPDAKRIAFSFTDTGHPATIQTVTLDTHKLTSITKHEGYTTAQFVRYQSVDGLEIPSFLYLPRRNAEAKHPAIIWLHGGFYSVMNAFDERLQYFVDQGFIVLAVNYRSSPGFGKELAKLGPGVVEKMSEDVAASINYLKTIESVDTGRIGVMGESLGGLTVLMSVTRHPELFAAAVDLYGPADLAEEYKAVPALRLFASLAFGGTPEQKPEAYRAASPVNFVERIKAPLLIMHGTADEAVPYTQSVKLVEALKRANKQHEFVTYQGEGHFFTVKTYIDSNEQALRFFSVWLRRKELR